MRHWLRGALTALGTLAAACGTAVADQRIVHEDKGFAIDAPAGWIVEKDAFGLPLTLRPPQGRLAHVTVGIDDHRPIVLPGDEAPHTPELDRYATLKLERSGYLTPPAQVHARERGSLHGQAVVRTTRSYRSGPVDYMARTYYLLGRNGTGYTITATAPRGDFDALAPRFDAILESFRLDSGTGD